MRKAIVVFVGLAIGVFAWQMVATGAETSDQDINMKAVDNAPSVSSSLVMQKMSLHPLSFTENQGQWDDRVLFRANAGGATMWFTNDGAYYQFTRRISSRSKPLGFDNSMSKCVETARVSTYPGEVIALDDPAGGPPFMVGTTNATSDLLRHDNQNDRLESIMIKASFVGANPNPNMVGLEEMEYKCNYFIGNDPNEWHTDVSNYEYVLYQDVYPGIDLKYYGNGKQMEYDFIVSPGADPSQIRIRYEGAKSLSVNEAGELEVKTDWNTVTEQAPFIYQETLDGRREVVGRYRLLENNTFGFALKEDYNSSLPLIIDPTLVYSTYLGGGDEDTGYGITVDGSGNAYVTGETNSPDFPTENPYQTDQGTWDAFVTKLSSSGNSLIYSTYLGGGGNDIGYDIAVDGSGAAYVTGRTDSPDFPTVNPYLTDQGSADIFVTKLSNTGNSLIYSTYLGGGDYDYGEGIAVDGSGNAYVTGKTLSSDFPILNPLPDQDIYQGGGDVFVTKLSSSGNSLIYSTYLGGGDEDTGLGIAVDVSGNAYVTGKTLSSDFPILNPLPDQDIYQGGGDVFVTKLSSSGNSLIYSTYLGGNGGEYGHAITVDGSGSAYVAGHTKSSNFPTENPYQPNHAGGTFDGFVTKLNSTGDGLIYSTYLGGDCDDFGGYGIAVDGSGNAYVTGSTSSSDFPTENPYQTDLQGYVDAFVTKLSSSGNSLIYSTYLGGGGTDYGEGIAVDGSGNAYVTGITWSSDFPTKKPYQTDSGGGDIFVTKLRGYICGDADANGIVEVSDPVYLIDYIFVPGSPPPIPYESGDADCNGIVEISDVVYLINYIFVPGSPAPCDPDGDGEPDC